MVSWAHILESEGKIEPRALESLVVNFVSTWFKTDYFVLIYGYGGPWEQMIPKKIVNQWIDDQLKSLDPK